MSVYRQMQTRHFQTALFKSNNFWYYSSLDTITDEASSLLAKLSGRQLVKMPSPLLQNLLSERIISTDEILSPKQMRALCRASPELSKNVRCLQFPCDAEQWIQYILSDLKNASTSRAQLDDELRSIPLIPAANGTLMTPKEGVHYYSLSRPQGESSPFGGFSELLVSGQMDSVLSASAAKAVVIHPQVSSDTYLTLIYLDQVLGIRAVEECPGFFLDFLNTAFCAEWLGKLHIQWPLGEKEWKVLWECCEKALLNDLSKAAPFLMNWPLLAVTNSAKDQSIQMRTGQENSTKPPLRLFKLSFDNNIVKTDPSSLNNGTKKVLDSLNTSFVDDSQRQVLDSIILWSASTCR